MTQIDFDTVLSDDDWLRRIARRLVGDPNTADDLAQEAWLAAHESGRGAGASRPWLAGVVRNAGFRVFRTQRRERDRVERAVDASETTSPATDEIVEALQLRERAARELLELEEPYRRAVYLVYVSDLSISEAARREGVATSTMSVRVQSGIAKLRARMDDAYGGDRRAWAGVLLPMAAPHRAASGAAAVIAWGVVAATVVLGLVGLWVRGRPGDGVEISPQQVGRAESPDGRIELASVASDSARDAEGSSVSGTAALGGGGRTARVSGRFLWPNGEPAAGADWSLRAWGRNERATAAFGELDEWEDVTGTLDADGRLSADFEPPVAAQFSFYVGDRDRARARWRWHGIRAGETRDVGTMSLHPVGIVTGRVVDLDGRPVVGIRLYVEIDEYEFEGIGGRSFNTTGSQVDPATGTFRIESVPAGRTTLVALNLGHRRVSDPRKVIVRAGEEVDVELAVDGVDDLADTVVVHVGCRPHQISRALDRPSVRLNDPSGYEHVGVASSPVSQSFEFEDVGAGPHVVRVEHAGFDPWERVDVEPGDIVRARLQGNAAIELDVRDPSGAPVSDFSVDVEGRFGTGRGDTWRAHAGGGAALPDGRVSGLVPGDWRLVIDADEGRAEVSVDGLQSGETRPVTATLVVAATVRGSFRRPDGASVPGVDVRLCTPAEVDDSSRSSVLDARSQTNRPERARLTVDRTVTDVDGRYRLRAPGAGRYVVVAFPLGAHQLDSSYVDVDDAGTVSGVDFVVPRECSVSGRIEFPTYLDPAGWSVQIAIDGMIEPMRLIMDRPAIQSDGRFHVPSLPSGRASLYVYQPDASDAWGPEQPTDAYLVSEFDLSPGQVVDRSFAWPDPAPMILIVELDVPVDLAPPERTFLTGQPVRGRIPRADGAGPTLDPIIAGALDYGIASRGRDWFFWQPSFVSATEGEVTRTLSIDVERRRLRVLIDGTPQPGAEVQLSVVSENFLRTTVTADAEGWLDIGLSPATYRFNAWRWSAELAWPPPAGQTELRLE